MTISPQLLPASMASQAFSVTQIRQIEQAAIAQLGQDTDGFSLMQSAAAALFALLQQRWPKVRYVLVHAGCGNNGGDGYLLAALAKARGYDIRLCQYGDHSDLSGAALQAKAAAVQAGVPIVTDFPQAELIVDALFGIGLNRPLPDTAQRLISAINHSAKPVLAVDIPSGLDANTGQCQPVAVRASVTLSFIGLKPGQLMLHGQDHCGDLLLAPLATESHYPAQAQAINLLANDICQQLLPARSRAAHKGQFGQVLVIGGDQGFGGAAIMAAQAAAHSGAGTVCLFTQQEHLQAMLSRQPEIMATYQHLPELLTKASVLCVGPGLGKGNWGQALMAQVLTCNKPMLLDADALNYLAQLPAAQQVVRHQQVITPHPAEAARLLHCTTAEVQQDRIAAVRKLQQRFGGTVLLKGNGSLICSSTQQLYLLQCGNPGMASGGMGDILAGIIAALMAQGLTPDDATLLGGWLHGTAADHLARRQGERGMLATALLPLLSFLLNGKTVP